jgi:phosphoribosylamine--glycine ligase
VPTAAAHVFDDADSCAAHLAAAPAPYVVKADGLAAGKGVHVGSDLAVATAFARDVLSDDGARAVVEDYLDGPEVSLFALTDGTTVLPLLPAQDHKRVGDGDTGPTPAAWAPTRRCPGCPTASSSRCSARCCSPWSTSCAAAARRSPACSTPASP